MPEKKTDVVEEKPEVSNFEMDQKYTKERFHSSELPTKEIWL